MSDANAESAVFESRDQAFKDAKSTFKYWMNALALAGNEQKDWEAKATEAYAIYEAEKGKARAFNILHANVETLSPAIYNSVPIPDVRTRFGDRNEAARQAGQVLERAATYSLDEYDFNDVIETVIRDGVVAGRGVVRVRYSPLMRTVQMEDENGQPVNREEVAWQTAPCDYVPWNKFRHGPAKIWADVPWIAFEQAYTRDELRQLADEKIADLIPLDMSDGDLPDTATAEEKSPFKKARVWEIWDKTMRRVFYIAPGFTEGPIAVEDDPLGLLDFFPMPRPLFALRKNKSLTPIVPYSIYEGQAKELNRICERILALINILRYRGVRASEIAEIEGLETLNDGEFVASEGAIALLAQGKSLDDAIWTMPLERIIQVVRELAAQRFEIKETIYEITGIADVMRGATQATETLGAQQLKAQWGSLRVQKMQADVQRFIRDILRLKCEIIASKYTVETLGYIAGEQVNEATIELLRGDIQRSYAIDIETDSTIRGDMARSQQNMSQFLQGVANYAQSIGPLIQQGVVPQDLALVLFDSFARQFKLGKQLEDKISEYVEMAGQQQKTPEQQIEQAKKDEAEQINRQGAILDLQKRQTELAKGQAEVEGQQIENTLAVQGVQMNGFIS